MFRLYKTLKRHVKGAMHQEIGNHMSLSATYALDGKTIAQFNFIILSSVKDDRYKITLDMEEAKHLHRFLDKHCKPKGE